MPFWSFYAPRGWDALAWGECPQRIGGRRRAERRGAPARPRMYSFLGFSFRRMRRCFFPFPFCWYEGAIMTGQAGRPGFLWYIETATAVAQAAADSLSRSFGPHVAG